MAWNSLDQYDKAIEYYELALASDLKTYGEDHPQIANDRNALGLAWHELGQYDKAVENYKLVLTTLETGPGKDHPNIARFAFDLAQNMLAAMGKKPIVTRRLIDAVNLSV